MAVPMASRPDEGGTMARMGRSRSGLVTGLGAAALALSCNPSRALVVVLDAGTDGEQCRVVEEDLRRFPAELLVVLDRSSSMSRRAAGATTSLWQEVTA